MDKILEALYNHFYGKPELAALGKSVEANHNLFRERLGEPEKELVLHLIDDETVIGFELAWKLTNELNHLERERSALTKEAEQSAHFVSEGGGEHTCRIYLLQLKNEITKTQ